MSRKVHDDKQQAPAQDFQNWSLPDIGDDDEPDFQPSFLPPGREPEPEPAEEVPQLPTAEEIEAMQKQAWDEAWEEGKKEGFEFGHREAATQMQSELDAAKDRLQRQGEELRTLIDALDKPFADLDNEVEDQLVTLAIALVKQLVRREIRTDPGQIVAVVREALAALPVASRSVRVLLHPEDAQLVRDSLTMGGEGEQSWELAEEPTLSRGGCRVVSETSRVEATLEARLNALIAQVFGGERASDE